MALRVERSSSAAGPSNQLAVTQGRPTRCDVQGINASVSAIALTLAPIVAGASYAAFGGGVTIWLAGAMAAMATVVAMVSAGVISTAAGQGLPHRMEHHHRQHGPVSALAHRISGGQRSFALNIHGRGRSHHGLQPSPLDVASD